MMARTLTTMLLALALATPAAAQRGRGQRSTAPVDYKVYNVPYAAREFTFVRIRYAEGFGGRFSRNPGWAHDYPRAERHFAQIVNELTNVDMRGDASNILMFDDPELFQYPVAYLSEPGYWTMSPTEEKGLRDYLLKGGFLIVDDFAGYGQWANFVAQVNEVFPEYRMVRLEATHPIFHSFFAIDDLDQFVHPYRNAKSEFWGMFEDNDPEKRLMIIANYNNDIGDYWEWSDEGWLPIDLSNNAYKLGVNYVVYTMTR